MSPDSSSAHDPSGRSGGGAVLDPLAVVRRNPQWFFRGGAFDADELLDLLAHEARRGGADVVSSRRDGDWFLFHADRDWLDGDVAAFLAPVTYAEGGRNSARVEVALTAFCRAVVTSAAGRRDEPVPPPAGTAPPDSDDATPGRTIAFLAPARSAAPVLDGQVGPHPPAERRLRLVPGTGEQRILSAVATFLDKRRSLDA